ncbi:MAG: efflux RND transporter permease subunit, partial [Bacteroidales bacterium]
NSGRETILGNRDGNAIVIKTDVSGESLGFIPVKNVNGRIIRVSDIATITLKEEMPTSFSRINGLNTINLSIKPDKGVNNLELIKSVKNKMIELSKRFPENFAAFIVSDQSTEIKGEIHKIMRRTVLSVIILLLFVYLVSRSLRYLAIIFITLSANIFIAFIFYYIFNLEIHIYSLAGITVSLGIIIDTSIIMIAHYGYYKNLKAFIAILAALLTTIGALTVVFLLPEQEKNMLMEFAAVIIINLTVSMAIALIFIPALIDRFPIKGVSDSQSINGARRVIRFNNLYYRYINFGRNHKWIFIVIIILGFGLPVQMLPSKIQNEETRLHEIYNKSIGSLFYQNKLKKKVEILLGGSLRLFQKNMAVGFGGLYRDPARPELTINASMPDGCTVQQLNDIVVFMENYLTQFNQIEMFYTNVSSYSNASIRVKFKKEVENTGFPLMLKTEVIAKAIDFGGANWSVSGIDDQHFSNYVGSSTGGSQRIVLTGYNYDLLYDFGLNSVEALSSNQRIREAFVIGSSGMRGRSVRNEYFIDFDRVKMAELNIDPSYVYYALNRKLASAGGASYKVDDDNFIKVKVISNEKESFDIWNLKNEYLDIGGRKIKFSDLGKIEMRMTGNDIFKQNQQYTINVAYNFIGSFELSKRVTERETERLNREVLPIGFKAGTDRMGWSMSPSKTFLLLLVVIAIIYLICAILFESLLEPLVIIILIPISFIGLFLTFYFTKFRFDQGGIAALIMLSGISVNAGIYLLNQYNLIGRDQIGKRSLIRNYIKSFNHKIIPILLTIVSTVLGLVPFLTDGPNEVFWFSFAVGTMGGLLFSLVGIVFVLPVFGKKSSVGAAF